MADIVPHFSVAREPSNNWERYSVMTKKPNVMKHDRFGALSSFSRFTPILPDTTAPDTAIHEATITLRPERRCFGKAQVWSECRLFYGWHRTPVELSMTVDGATVSTEECGKPAVRMLTRTVNRRCAEGGCMMTMKGSDSPDVYGISLEGRNGVAMDNIPARGAACVRIPTQ